MKRKSTKRPAGVTAEQWKAQRDLKRKSATGRRADKVASDLLLLAWLNRVGARLSDANESAWAQQRAEVFGVYGEADPMAKGIIKATSGLLHELRLKIEGVRARLLRDAGFKSDNLSVILGESQDPHPH
jgi:hypothetical protein